MSPISKALGLVTHGLTRHTLQQELFAKNQKFLASIPVIKASKTPASIRQYRSIDPCMPKLAEKARSSKSESHGLSKLNEQQRAIFSRFKAMTRNHSRAETLAKLGELDKTDFFKTSDDESEQALRTKHFAKLVGRYFTPAQMAVGEELGYALFKELAADLEQRKMEAEKVQETEQKEAERIQEAARIKAGLAKGNFVHTKFEAFRCHVCFAEKQFRMSQEYQLVAESGYDCLYCAHKCMECAECEKF